MAIRKPITYVLLVVDRSGSMSSLAADVVGGLNTYLDSLKADEDMRYRVTLALFNENYQVAEVDAKPRAFVQPYTTQWYQPQGMTALYYAVGRTITDFDERHPALKEGDKVLLLVNTDGEENSSHRICGEDRKPEFTGASVKALLEAKAVAGWGTIYMGSTPESWGKGDTLGYGQQVNIRTGAEGTRSAYSGMSGATRTFSRTGDAKSAAAEIDKAAGVDNA